MAASKPEARFDIDRFNAKKFEVRTEDIDVTTPALAQFFGVTRVTWKVRQLSLMEIAKVRATLEERKQKLISAVIEGIAGGKINNQAEAVLSALGISSDAPDEYVRWLEFARLGSVEPEVTYAQLVEVGSLFPAIIIKVGKRIELLSDQGAATVGKSPRSTPTAESKPPSDSAT